jgi:hypothetical protein
MRAAIEQHLGEPLSPSLEREFEQLYTDAYDKRLTAVDGIHEALAEIPEPTCVASSSEPDSLRYKLELAGSTSGSPAGSSARARSNGANPHRICSSTPPRE